MSNGMCCFYYFLRLVEKSSASSFDDLRYMTDYNVSFVGKVNFKFNLKIIPTILKLVDHSDERQDDY